VLRAREVDRETCRACAFAKQRGRRCAVHAHRPRLAGFVDFYVDLYRQVQVFKALPDEGGILDQEDQLMWILAIVAGEVEIFDEERRPKSDASSGKNEIVTYRRPSVR